MFNAQQNNPFFFMNGVKYLERLLYIFLEQVYCWNHLELTISRRFLREQWIILKEWLVFLAGLTWSGNKKKIKENSATRIIGEQLLRTSISFTLLRHNKCLIVCALLWFVNEQMFCTKTVFPNILTESILPPRGTIGLRHQVEFQVSFRIRTLKNLHTVFSNNASQEVVCTILRSSV